MNGNRLVAAFVVAVVLVATTSSSAVRGQTVQPQAPVIRSFAVWMQNTAGDESPSLVMAALLDDPDGQVPLTIQSVIVIDPNNTVFDLSQNFTYPNSSTVFLSVPASPVALRGQYGYWYPTTNPPYGDYTLVVTDVTGASATATDSLSLVANPPLPLTVTYPTSPPTYPNLPPIVPTTTPTFTWLPDPNAGAIYVRICNSDQFNLVGETLYASVLLGGGGTGYALPAGILEEGRSYALRLEAFDTAAPPPSANYRASTFKKFLVVGANPDVALFLNNNTQNTFTTGDTLSLGVDVRRLATPTPVHVTLWWKNPATGLVAQILRSARTIPGGPPDVSIVRSSIFTYTFTGSEIEGNYAIGIRLTDPVTEGVLAQSTVAFAFAP